jgi:hypothetical protein
MDLTKMEILAIEETVREAREEQVNDLTELQLALVGGGNGETILC